MNERSEMISAEEAAIDGGAGIARRAEAARSNAGRLRKDVWEKLPVRSKCCPANISLREQRRPQLIVIYDD
jgi:hypothetical protein